MMPISATGREPSNDALRESSNDVLNRLASAGIPLAAVLQDVSDESDDSDDLEAELDDMPITDSCDAVRRMIRAFLDNGDMKVGEFQKAIHTNSKTYSNFMTQSGPYKGAGSSVYTLAWRFFKKREMQGIPLPKQSTKPKKGGQAAAAPAASDLASIELPGEMDDNVEIYDTCDDIRRKINAHLKKPGVTQAQFLRDIAASYRRAPRKIQSTQLSTFRSKKGALQGNNSAVFYGAYIYFEKLRIAEKKPKSQKRLEMEEIHSIEGGVDTGRPRKYIVPVGTRPYVDQYGQTRC